MPDRPLLLYDGDCRFCRRWIARWRRRTGGRIEYAPWQEAAGRFPEIEPERFETAVILIEPDGRVTSGAEAVFRTLAAAPRGGLPLRLYRSFPAAARLAEAAYRFVAARRGGISRLSAILSGPLPEPPSRRWSRALFIRLLGLIYLLAFGSLGLQITGLVGENGILPAQPFLDQVGARFGGAEGWRLLPGLFWWIGAGDLQLQLVCAAGALLAILLMAGLAPAPILALLWFGYLSVTGIGRQFLQFQWDALLLETGLLAIWFAPPGLRPGRWRDREPGPVALGLIWWLLFRLMFESGVVKLSSGDPTWRNLTALQYHYETQPLPGWTAWYAHQLPEWLHRGSVVGMFAVELAVPFLIFAPRRLRFGACALLIGLQVGIGLTGSYGFFNLLSILLCLALLDDPFWKRWLPERVGRPIPVAAGAREGPGKRVAAALLALLIVAVTVPQLRRSLDRRRPYTEPVRTLMRWTGPFRSINSYGLFAVMTTTRPEIVVEGSDDGTIWKPYRFRWKPGDPARRPRFAAPHMPRLDWQMWFAALGSTRTQPWFPLFLRRLLEGSPEVLDLLEGNPFPGAPPRYIRSVLYHYRFTDFATRRAEGTWWRRERKSFYTAAMFLPAGESRRDPAARPAPGRRRARDPDSAPEDGR